MQQNQLTTKQVLDRTGVKFYVLNYLVKSGQVEAQNFGKGIERRFDPSVIDKILAIKRRRGEL